MHGLNDQIGVNGVNGVHGVHGVNEEELPPFEAPVIDSALVTPGHDGAAELVVQVRYANGARDSVTLDAHGARRLFELCGAESVADLAGKPWDHLMHVLAP